MTTKSRKTKRIAVIGAGPIGLEAALAGRCAGYNVDLYEQGGSAANVLKWGHVRLFSPFGMNSSPRGRDALYKNGAGDVLPDEGDYLTGAEYAERYLLPLSRLPELTSLIHEQMRVIGVSRAAHWKADLIGQLTRGDDPFRLLLEAADGAQSTALADFVFDCSGVYPHHNWLGAGGIPAVNELAAESRIEYGLPDILGGERRMYAGRTTLVVGGGYSAATAVCELAELSKSHPGTKVFWLTRSDRAEPLPLITNDPLPERATLTERAHHLVEIERGPVQLFSGRMIDSVTYDSRQDGFQVVFHTADRSCESEKLHADRVIANVGYHPDHSLSENLQVHLCYATAGPIKLAAALLGETSADCLSQNSAGGEVLRNPEPGFFILGAKSYGRDSRFLIRVGLQQIEEVFSLIADERPAP